MDRRSETFPAKRYARIEIKNNIDISICRTTRTNIEHLRQFPSKKINCIQTFPAQVA
jgi:hypothetical protein